jgi:hypothetical protein
MTSIGCRAGHPLRGPTLEEAIEVGAWAPLEQLEKNAKRRLSAAPPTTGSALGTPRRWEGRSPMASPPSSPTQSQAKLHFGLTHASRPLQPSPRNSSPAARGQSMRSGRSWTPIMQRHVHLDSWAPAACTSTAHVSKMADVTEKFHKKAVGDNNTRRVNAHAALLRMLARESEAANEPPPDPAETVRQRTQRKELRADADRWKMRPPNQATYEQEHAAALNSSAVIMGPRELAASWAANERQGSSNTGWTQGFAASARGRTNIYAHRAARNRSHTARETGNSTSPSDTTAGAHVAPEHSRGAVSWAPPHAGTPRSPQARQNAAMSPSARAEAEVMRQLLGDDAVVGLGHGSMPW